MDELLYQIDRAIRSLNPGPGTPAGGALMNLKRIDRELAQIRTDAHRCRSLLEELARAEAEVHHLKRSHEAEQKRLHKEILDHKVENQRIREHHKQLAGDAGEVMRSLSAAMNGHAAKLLDLSRRKAP